MPSRNYLQHGSRHRPTGSDPIPGLGSSAQSWAYMPGNFAGKSFSGAGGTPIGGRSGHMYTNDSSVFAEASRTIGGTSYHGVSFLAAGHYYVKAMLILLGVAAGGNVVGIDEAASDASDALWEYNGQVSTSVTNTCFFEAIQSVDGSTVTIPTGALIFAGLVSSGASTFSGQINVFVRYLDTNATLL